MNIIVFKYSILKSFFVRLRYWKYNHITFGDDTRTFNRSLENKTPPDYGPREEFYRITPACDSNVSMRSVSENPPASDNLNTERAQSPNGSNRNEQLNDRQDIEGGRYQPSEPFNSTNFDARDRHENPADEPIDDETHKFCV